MDVDAARAVLGVTALAEWTEVRAAYRAQIRRSHPDLAGDDGVARSVELNAAYRSLALAHREGRLHQVVPPTEPARPERPRHRRSPAASHPDAPDDVGLRDGDTIVLSSTPGEAFRRLVEAADSLGEVSYVDRSSAIFEAVLELDDGNHASLVVSLQWRAHDATCEAFCTLEALDRAEHLDVSGVLEQLVQFLPPDREA